MIGKQAIIAAPLALALLAGVANAQSAYNQNTQGAPGPGTPTQGAPVGQTNGGPGAPSPTNAGPGTSTMPGGTSGSVRPGIPNTGAGGTAQENAMILVLAGAAAAAGVYLASCKRAL